MTRDTHEWTLALIRAAVAYDRAVADVNAGRITPETYQARMRELLEAAIGGMDTEPPDTPPPDREYEWKVVGKDGSVGLYSRPYGSSEPWALTDAP